MSDNLLRDYRDAIDVIDTDLVGLLVRRRRLVERVAAYKRSAGLALRDHAREYEIVERARRIGGDAIGRVVAGMLTEFATEIEDAGDGRG